MGYSAPIDRYYIGETEDLERRIQQHRTDQLKGGSTTTASDRELKHFISTSDRADARKVEAFIKKMKSRKVLEPLINDGTYRSGFLRHIHTSAGIIFPE
ncbi:MAG: GIY-YIG nuclease family protein [Chitinophagaceae bacterium]|nr:MAG: GIY-YIG nuclease family protein [Chitinophagaceae bacterium]